MDVRATDFGVADAKARFSELLQRAEHGESITIRRHGRAVARLVPAEAVASVEERRRAHRDYVEWVRSHGPRLGPGLTIRQLIDEGRDRS